MELNSSFDVQAPVEKVWATLMDIERVAGCLPGAEVLSKLSDDAYQLGVKVKLGPVTMQYRGQLNVAERDEANRRAVLSGQAKETRGQGTATATATMTLTENGGRTTGAIHTDLALSGKAAAMGKSVIGSVSDQLMRQFAANLQSMMDQPAAADVADGEGRAAETVPPTPVPVTDQPADVVADLPPHDGQAGTASPSAETTLNALALAKGVAADQLSDPRKVGALVAVVSVVGYLLGRRAGRRR